jgi:hypothetical protein
LLDGNLTLWYWLDFSLLRHHLVLLAANLKRQLKSFRNLFFDHFLIILDLLFYRHSLLLDLV